MLSLLFITGLLSNVLCTLTIEAEAGDNVMLWCHHDLDHAGYIFWFYQRLAVSSLSSTSTPQLIGCKHFKTSGSPSNCYFITQSERLEISVVGKKTSVSISAVNASDTGLYYCSSMQLNHITFGQSTYLWVKEGNETLLNISGEQAQDSLSSTVGGSALFFILNSVFGSVIVILLVVLIVIAVKYKNAHGVGSGDPDQDHDWVNYRPVQQLSRKANRTRGRGQTQDLHYIYTHVIYEKLT